MKTVNTAIISDATNASTESVAIDTLQVYAASFMAVFTDNSAAGTLKLQFSNDVSKSQNLPSGWTPTNWLDVPSATVTVSSGATSSIPMPLSFSYRWLKLVWTRTGGAGTFTVNMNSQGF